MKADKKWSDLGWRHPLWDLVRYYLSLRGSQLPAEFRQALQKDQKLLIKGKTEFPIAEELCLLFEEYLDARGTQFNSVFSSLRTEAEALDFCKKLGVMAKKTTTKRDHHQSPKALVATVSEIAKSVCTRLSMEIDTNPQSRCVWCHNNGLHVSARRIDGAVPGLFNSDVIWEIKEYWGKTSGGSKMSDAVYECHLVGLEMRLFEEKSECKISHIVFVDGKDQWSSRKSDLHRFIDLLNQGFIDHLFVGKMVESEWESTLSQLLE